jgi:transposase
MGQEKMEATLPTNAADVTIGIDISKQILELHVHPDRLSRRFTNDQPGLVQLIDWLGVIRPTRIVFEATGAYRRALEMALAKAGLPAVKVNPLQARRFAEATGKRAKTDPVDAAMLARFGAALQPTVPPARDRAIDTLRELRVAREGLVKDRTATLNRGHTLTLALLKRQNSRRLQQIERHIAAIDHEMARLREEQTAFKRRCDIVESIPGFGSASAFALLIDMPELGTLDAKQAASLGGLAPVTRQSGIWQGKSFIQGGRAGLRQALYMPALVAIRYNPDLKAKYEALRKAGKPAKVAIVAIMRKLLLLANALLRDNRLWTADHGQTAK